MVTRRAGVGDGCRAGLEAEAALRLLVTGCGWQAFWEDWESLLLELGSAGSRSAEQFRPAVPLEPASSSALDA